MRDVVGVVIAMVLALLSITISVLVACDTSLGSFLGGL